MLEAGDVGGPVRAGCEVQQDEFITGADVGRQLEHGGGGLRALAEISGCEAALAEVGEDGAAHDPRTQRVAVDGHRTDLPDVASDLAEGGGAEHDLAARAGRVALQQGG